MLQIKLNFILYRHPFNSLKYCLKTFLSKAWQNPWIYIWRFEIAGSVDEVTKGQFII